MSRACGLPRKLLHLPLVPSDGQLWSKISHHAFLRYLWIVQDKAIWDMPSPTSLQHRCWELVWTQAKVQAESGHGLYFGN